MPLHPAASSNNADVREVAALQSACAYFAVHVHMKVEHCSDFLIELYLNVWRTRPLSKSALDQILLVVPGSAQCFVHNMLAKV